MCYTGNAKYPFEYFHRQGLQLRKKNFLYVLQTSSRCKSAYERLHHDFLNDIHGSQRVNFLRAFPMRGIYKELIRSLRCSDRPVQCLIFLR
jgi:hypothetical protein